MADKGKTRPATVPKSSAKSAPIVKQGQTQGKDYGMNPAKGAKGK